MVRRLLLYALVALGLAAAGVAIWLRSEGGALVELSESEVAAARASGAGSREIVVAAEDAEAPLPTIEELKGVASREEIDDIARRVSGAYVASSGEARALLAVLSSEVERLRGNVDECYRLARAGAEALPRNSRARHAYGKAILARILKDADADGGGMKAIVRALDDVKAYQAEVKAAIELDPANVDARVAQVITLAFAPWPIGNKTRAKALIEEIGEYDPFRRDFWRAQLLVADKSKLDEALSAYLALDARQPGDLDVVFTLGELYVKKTDWRAAAERFDSLITEGPSPHSYRAMFEGAKVRELGGFELELALERLEVMETADPIGDLMPSMQRIKLQKGRILRRLERLDEARTALLEADRLRPGRASVSEALADVDAELAARDSDG